MAAVRALHGMHGSVHRPGAGREYPDAHCRKGDGDSHGFGEGEEQDS